MLSAVSREGRLGGRSQPGFWSRLFARGAGQEQETSKGRRRSCAGVRGSQTVSFRDGRIHTLELVDECKINCIAGMVWITSQDRRCDYILSAGESLVLRKRGKVIISGGGRRDGVVEVLCECRGS